MDQFERPLLMARRIAIPVMSLLLSACSATDPIPLAGDELPFFPSCVAREDGGYQERKLTRLSWFPARYNSESTIIDANCISVEP